MADINKNKASDSYNISHWSQGYFGIGKNQELVVSPDPDNPKLNISLYHLAQQIVDKGLTPPILVRFPQILHHRVHNICQAFANAIKKYQYQRDYLLIYPIKVNQQKNVVESIISSHESNDMAQLGLEAGSKPELMAVLAMAQRASSIIICNGYKDTEYIRLALIGEKLGHKVYIVLEKVSELQIVLNESKKMNVVPRLGLRARLAIQGKGKWQASGGEKSKFGLSSSQIIHVINKLSENKILDSLQLLHFHLGSQIGNIRDIRKGVSEAAHFYCELRKLGANIQCVDVGGGLAIDYDGTRTQSNSSMNYGLTEYANNIVNVLADVCIENNEIMPRIISESGRYLTAHHAVLITDVIGVERYQVDDISPPNIDEPQILQNMWQSWIELKNRADSRAQIEIFHDSQLDLSEVHSLFSLGQLSIQQRAWAEQINLRICFELQNLVHSKNRYHRGIIDELNEKLAAKYFVNFSLFQSLPDAWGIEQVFPVLPLSNVNSNTTERAVMLDITCDSDGAIKQYVDGQGIETTIPMPVWSEDNPYLIGFFLVGAYQEILGDLHNLFGDTHSAEVRINDDGKMCIDSIQYGDKVDDVLGYVSLNSDDFMNTYNELVNKYIPINERSIIIEELRKGLQGYTYLEDIN